MNPAHEPSGKKIIINVPEVEVEIEPLSAEEIKADEERSLELVQKELQNGFAFIQKYKKSVSFFGSARFSPDSLHAKQAEELARRVVEDLGYAVITGGGPGIMQAANKGATEAGGISLGLAIKLPHEQITNPYVKDQVGFYYFFTRKTILTFAAEAYVFFPGGFGTLDEFFDILTLIQTRKIPRVPLFLFGRDFWQPLHEFIKLHVYEIHNAIKKYDMELYKIVDIEDLDEIIHDIKQTPVATWWKNYEM